MELVVADGAQQDGTPVGEVGTIVEHGLGFADDNVPVIMFFPPSSTTDMIYCI